MNRLGNKVFFSVVASLVAVSLAACGGGSRSAALPSAVATPGVVSPDKYVEATFRISIPGPTAPSAKGRKPAYVSQATKSVKITLTSPSIGVNGTTTLNVTAGDSNCPVDAAHAGNYACTVKVRVPPGSDAFTFQTYDNVNGTGNVLSQQIQTLTVVAAIANSFTIIFDANLGTMTVNGSGACQNGPVGSTFGSVGTTPVVYTVAFTDAAGKTIVAPGVPKIAVQDNTSTYQTSAGTINAASGGTVGFTINQSTQTFTLTPSSSTVTNASVNVKAIPANTTGSSDGLSFAPVKTFAFSTGAAPPLHNFLATVEQSTGGTSGQVDFFNVALGGSGGADNISAFSTAPTLAQTNSTNEGKPDVDNPLSLGWDFTGDLLIGNGNDGGANHGNMACVPVGAIATNNAAATTISSNVTSPVALAYDSRDGSVALANNPVGAPVQMPSFLLNGNYAAAPGTGPGTRNLVASGLGNNFVVNVPFLSTGTYASALSDGCEVDSAHTSGAPCPTTGVSKIAIYTASGSETDITDTSTFAIDNPTGLAWDDTNKQLAIGNFTVWHPSLSFYAVSPVSQVKVIGLTAPIRRPFIVAASPDGHIAVAWVKSPGAAQQVQVYDNTTSRSAVGGVINFKVASDSGTCNNLIYGTDGAVIHALTWLSNTKLLVALEATSGGAFQSSNGIYVYDISSLVAPSSQYDKSSPGCPQMTATAPKQTGFVQFSKRPLGSAFKP